MQLIANRSDTKKKIYMSIFIPPEKKKKITTITIKTEG